MVTVSVGLDVGLENFFMFLALALRKSLGLGLGLEKLSCPWPLPRKLSP